MNQARKVPTLVIDARMISRHMHGIARYVGLMAQGLKIAEGKSGGLPYRPVFLVTREMEHHLKSFLGFDVFPCSSDFLDTSEWMEIPRVLRELGADLYHSPSFSSLPGRYGILESPCPWIVTLHDLNHINFSSGQFSFGLRGLFHKIYYRAVLKNFAKRAEKVLTVSQFSAREIMGWIKDLKDPPEVVYNALDPKFLERLSEEALSSRLGAIGLQKEKYFLCVSNPKPHKNLGLMLSAFEQFQNQVEDGEIYPLVLTTSAISKTSRVMSLGDLDQDQALAVLQGAHTVFCPSLYEGFGLPPMEAVAVGKRVCVSMISAHEEALSGVGKKYVRWVGPNDIEGFKNAFLDAQTKPWPAPSEEKDQASVRWVRDTYTVARLGETMDRIYRSMLSKRAI